MNENVLDYIRANHDTYTRQAITGQLLQQGYSQAEIDEAWRLVEQETANPGLRVAQPSIWTMRNFWLSLLGFVLGVSLIIGVVGRIFRGPGGSINNLTQASIISLLLIVIVIIATIINIVSTWQHNRAVSRGLLVGLIVAFGPPFIGWFIIGGICLVG